MLRVLMHDYRTKKNKGKKKASPVSSDADEEKPPKPEVKKG